MAMDKKEFMLKVAAILTTLLEVSGAPESQFYIFCDMDMDKWNYIRNFLIAQKWISVKGNYVTLTTEGKEIAEKLNAAIGK